MKKLLFAALMLFVATAFGADGSKYEISGAELNGVLKDAIKLIQPLSLQWLKGKTITENEVVVITDLKKWMKATGYDKVPENRLHGQQLADSVSFILTEMPDGTSKQSPWYPIFFRRDTDFWNDQIAMARGLERQYAVCVLAGMLVHESAHTARYFERSALEVQMNVLQRFGAAGTCSGDRFQSHLARIQKAWWEERQAEEKILASRAER